MMDLTINNEVFKKESLQQRQRRRCSVRSLEGQRHTGGGTRRLSSLLSEDLISSEFMELDLSNNKTGATTTTTSNKVEDIECFVEEEIDDPFHPIDVHGGTNDCNDDAESIFKFLNRRRSALSNFLQAIPLPVSSMEDKDGDAIENDSSGSSSDNDEKQHEEEENHEDDTNDEECDELKLYCPPSEVRHSNNQDSCDIRSSNDEQLQEEEEKKKEKTTGASASASASGDSGGIIMIEQPRPYDVICGRNCAAFNSVGNRRFRLTIAMNLERYTKARRRDEKTKIIHEITNMLLDHDQNSRGGGARAGAGARFLKKLGANRYKPLSLKQIHEKIGHCFREVQAQHSQSQSQPDQRFDPFEKYQRMK